MRRRSRTELYSKIGRRSSHRNEKGTANDKGKANILKVNWSWYVNRWKLCNSAECYWDIGEDRWGQGKSDFTIVIKGGKLHGYKSWRLMDFPVEILFWWLLFSPWNKKQYHQTWMNGERSVLEGWGERFEVVLLQNDKVHWPGKYLWIVRYCQGPTWGLWSYFCILPSFSALILFVPRWIPASLSFHLITLANPMESNILFPKSSSNILSEFSSAGL